MFEVADQDGDGRLVYEELFAVMTAMNDEASSTALKRLVAHTRTHTHTHNHTYTCTRVCMYTRVCARTHACTRTRPQLPHAHTNRSS